MDKNIVFWILQSKWITALDSHIIPLELGSATSCSPSEYCDLDASVPLRGTSTKCLRWYVNNIYEKSSNILGYVMWNAFTVGYKGKVMENTLE